MKGKAYHTVLYGLPLGYVVSYFFQSTQFRSGTPLAEYLQSAPSILSGAASVNGVCATAWLAVTVCMSAIGLVVWRFGAANTSLRENISQSTRFALGGLLFYAGFVKVADIPKFAEEVEHYKIAQLFPDSFQPPLLFLMRLAAVTLPWNELAIGAMILLGIWTRTAALLSLFFFMIFTAAVTSAVLRKLNISCGCFNSEGAARVGLQTLALDALGLALSLAVFLFSSTAKAASR